MPRFSIAVRARARQLTPQRLFLQRLLSEDSGAEIVEFALCVCVWIACVFAIFYGSFALYAAHFVANAAEDGARYAMVRGSTWSGTSCSTTSTLECTATSDNIASYVSSTVPPGISAAKLHVSASWPGTMSTGSTCDNDNGNNSPNCLVEVDVSYTFSFPLPFLTQQTIPMASSSQITIAQ